METAVDATVLTILGAAFGVMFATLTTLMVGSMRVQHRDSTEIRQVITQESKENRDLIERASKENRDLIERASKENRDLIERATDRLSAEFEEHKGITARNHEKVTESLSDARERLARIEGHVGIGQPPTRGSDPGGGSSEAV